MMSVTKGIIRNSMRNSRIIKKVVNHDLLLNKLRCDDLINCNCVPFVKSLSVEDIESSRNVWLRFMKSHHKWCPVGPPGGVEAITQEEEEEALEKEIMERELEKYKDEDDKRDIEYLDEILRRAA
tara:strand:- start:77 stop:451 length:375 start_codon:yes stop_codon:yes gene_type:complete